MYTYTVWENNTTLFLKLSITINDGQRVSIDRVPTRGLQGLEFPAGPFLKCVTRPSAFSYIYRTIINVLPDNSCRRDGPTITVGGVVGVKEREGKIRTMSIA
jgi:hypothetical protein